jgi:Transposase DDE domain
VYWYFNQWEQARVTEKILPVVRAQLRVQEGRNPEPSAGLIDSQSVKGADTVGRDTRGYDAGKKVNGRKRFIVTDTLSLSASGQPFDPETSLRVPPGCAGDTTRRLAAHMVRSTTERTRPSRVESSIPRRAIRTPIPRWAR